MTSGWLSLRSTSKPASQCSIAGQFSTINIAHCRADLLISRKPCLSRSAALHFEYLMPHRFLHPGQLGQRHRLGPGIEVERVIMGVSAARGLREGGTSRPWRLNSVTPID